MMRVMKENIILGIKVHYNEIFYIFRDKKNLGINNEILLEETNS
jgi:hypothetical protein